jgi:hypothetical protein
MDQDQADTNGESNHTDRVVDEFSFLIRDKNHDGVLERDEFDEGRSVFDRLSDPERFERYDTDGDGVVTREEFLAGRATDRTLDQDQQSPAGPNDIPLLPGTGPLARREAED